MFSFEVLLLSSFLSCDVACVSYIYIYRRKEQECRLWLKQRLTPRKTASIMTLIEQMVETKGWKVARGLMENGRCRLCGEFNETVEHLVAGCKTIATKER